VATIVSELLGRAASPSPSPAIVTVTTTTIIVVVTGIINSFPRP
jgi:hypothetical protein